MPDWDATEEPLLAALPCLDFKISQPCRRYRVPQDSGMFFSEHRDANQFGRTCQEEPFGSSRSMEENRSLVIDAL
jgi:hypothetical protein